MTRVTWLFTSVFLAANAMSHKVRLNGQNDDVIERNVCRKMAKMGYFELSRFSVGQLFGASNNSESPFRISKFTFVGMKILVP